MRRVPTVALAKVGCFCLPESYGWQAKFHQKFRLFVRSLRNRYLDCGPKWTQQACAQRLKVRNALTDGHLPDDGCEKRGGSENLHRRFKSERRRQS